MNEFVKYALLILGAIILHFLFKNDSFEHISLNKNAEFAQNAKTSGHIINNDTMKILYPLTFKSGEPEYLERDFEAGANFICDELVRIHKKDICASSIEDGGISWR